MTVSNKHNMEAHEKAIEEAKNGCEAKWISDHQNGRTCPDNNVIHLKSVGEKTAQKMIDHKITTVEMVMNNTPEQLSAMTEGKINASTTRTGTTTMQQKSQAIL